ncbi:metallophosphoesterase family protein [Sphingomonas sp. LT1P40]|uniref:metallophosphoesterase family protein n=1 Tax=Alteristakelama amylovorans TaxID=3096166 RepID=UPI002FC95041
MLRRLLSAFAPEPAPVTTPVGAVPPGQRVYAVGDIHGRLDLLDDLLVRIEADDATRAPMETTLIFLGDLVDRGPDSAQVVQRLLDLSRESPSIRFLLGNHEEVFLKALAGEKGALPFFIKIGGKPTTLSYGITEDEYLDSDYPALLDLLQARVPGAHIDFISRFEDVIVIGDYAFVHAGIKPDLPLDRQNIAALRWIREEFLGHDQPLEKVVVHGHTISTEVEERVCRIGLDTGAYASGRLTAMGFEASDRWILQTKGTSTKF